MAKIVWFRRSDGTEISTEEGSYAHELMDKDGAFTLLVEPGGEEVKNAEAPATPAGLEKLSKKQLFVEAAERGIPVTEKMTKAEIIAAIEAGQIGEEGFGGDAGDE